MLFLQVGSLDKRVVLSALFGEAKAQAKSLH